MSETVFSRWERLEKCPHQTVLDPFFRQNSLRCLKFSLEFGVFPGIIQAEFPAAPEV